MGRPSKLTPERIQAITGALRAGATREMAARSAGIHPGTLFAWLAKGRAANRGSYYEFHEAVKKAEARNGLEHLVVVRQAAKNGSWQASAWMLERRHGYRRDSTFHIDEKPTPAPTTDPAAESTERYLARQLEAAEQAVGAARAEGSWQAAVNGQRMAISLREKLDAVRASEAADFAVDDAATVAAEIRELLAIPAIAEAFGRGTH